MRAAHLLWLCVVADARPSARRMRRAAPAAITAPPAPLGPGDVPLPGMRRV